MTETARKKPRTELSKEITRLNSLRAKRAKVTDLDAEIEVQEKIVARMLGLSTSTGGDWE